MEHRTENKGHYPERRISEQLKTKIEEHIEMVLSLVPENRQTYITMYLREMLADERKRVLQELEDIRSTGILYISSALKEMK